MTGEVKQSLLSTKEKRTVEQTKPQTNKRENKLQQYYGSRSVQAPVFLEACTAPILKSSEGFKVGTKHKDVLGIIAAHGAIFLTVRSSRPFQEAEMEKDYSAGLKICLSIPL